LIESSNSEYTNLTLIRKGVRDYITQREERAVWAEEVVGTDSATGTTGDKKPILLHTPSYQHTATHISVGKLCVDRWRDEKDEKSLCGTEKGVSGQCRRTKISEG
jgi:hypothetical protein